MEASPPLVAGGFEAVFRECGPRSLVTRDRCAVLFALAACCLPLEGEFWECGVFKGGTARLIAEVVRLGPPRILRLFDSFKGLPKPDDALEHALRGEGTFSDTSVESVQQFIPYDFVQIRPGFIPGSLVGFEGTRIAFAHLDLDLYHSTYPALSFVLPRTVPGGVIVIDDYGHPDWTGVKPAVDKVMRGRPIIMGPDWQGIIRV